MVVSSARTQCVAICPGLVTARVVCRQFFPLHMNGICLGAFADLRRHLLHALGEKLARLAFLVCNLTDELHVGVTIAPFRFETVKVRRLQDALLHTFRCKSEDTSRRDVVDAKGVAELR